MRNGSAGSYGNPGSKESISCRGHCDLKGSNPTLSASLESNENAITFFVHCEAKSIALKNCPAYVREWINALRRES
jgi:hypothetical protein